MGSGFKTFTAASVLTAADLNNFCQSQSVMYFATTAARDTAITSPVDGMVAYIGADDCLYLYETISAVSAWRRFTASVPHTSVARRVIANNQSVSSATYADLSATDKTALTISFTKYRPDTKLVVQMSTTVVSGAGTSVIFKTGLSVNGSTYDVVSTAIAATFSRYFNSGVAEITGIPVGTYNVFPQWKSASGASTNQFFLNDDFISYSITETL
jgi:hypothetical protein